MIQSLVHVHGAFLASFLCVFAIKIELIKFSLNHWVNICKFNFFAKNASIFSTIPARKLLAFIALLRIQGNVNGVTNARFANHLVQIIFLIYLHLLQLIKGLFRKAKCVTTKAFDLFVNKRWYYLVRRDLQLLRFI